MSHQLSSSADHSRVQLTAHAVQTRKSPAKKARQAHVLDDTIVGVHEVYAILWLERGQHSTFHHETSVPAVNAVNEVGTPAQTPKSPDTQKPRHPKAQTPKLRGNRCASYSLYQLSHLC